LPAIAVAFTGSLFKIVPVLQGNRPMAVIITIGVMWLIVFTNLRGVKEAGLVAEVTTYSKLVPFAAISIIGLFFIRPGNLSEFNPSGQSLLASAATLAPLTMFAYLGLESATVPAGDVKDPARTIPLSTIIGVSIAALLYVLGTTGRPRRGAARGTGEVGRAVRRCRTDHVGRLGRGHRGRRGHDFVARSTEWVDAAHGPGADGSRTGQAVP
jgi:hypothetical protein